MNQSLTHLPESKQKDLKEILDIILEVANPEKVILFGSHTSDRWIEDEYVENGATYSYISDYDFLIVIKNGDKEKERDIASKIENRTLKFNNDVSPIVHIIEYINKGLEVGQYFFRDIVAEGIVLFDTHKYQFAEVKVLTKEQEKQLAAYYFDKYVKSGSRFLDHTRTLLPVSIEKGYELNEVIFMLTQAAEKFYAGVLLVCTGYKPKTHKFKVYRKYSKNLSEELNKVFRYPLDDNEEYRLFDLFEKSYLDSRYKDDYFISKEDLEKLIFKVEKLEKVTIAICEERIESL